MIKYGFLCLILAVCIPVKSQFANQKLEIANFLDMWHLAASVADEDAFFGAFAPNGIYVGTDETEHWTAVELQEWSKSAFERESAWVFTAKSRNIYLAEDGNFAWFDELLNTWMGTCRGSGVLQKIDGQWKIEQYVLSVTVPNDKIEGFIELVNGKK